MGTGINRGSDADMTAGKGLIAVATSIPPKQVREEAGRAREDYQSLCVQSWVANGFRILSVNHPDEIPGLAARHPEVTFIPATRTAREWTGRDNPFIADLLLALKDASEPVLGLINSDLLFEPSAAWTAHLPGLVPHAMAVVQRYNTHCLADGALRRFQGLDCFFFDRTMALRALDHAMPFVIGAPWWDYWLPCMALLSNRGITVVDRPAVLHLFHKTAYSKQNQVVFGRALADILLRENENARYPQSPILAAVKPILQDIAEPSLDSEVLKGKFADFCRLFISEIRGNTVTWDAPKADGPATSPPPKNSENTFERLGQRLAAGQAFQDARALWREKRLSEVGPDMVAAMQQAPQDLDMLMMLGEIFVHRREFETAASLFAEAAERNPDSPTILHRQGVLLRATGRAEESLSYFARALQIEPAHQPSCLATAKVLDEMNRTGEAIAFLDEAVARYPELTRAAELRDSYRRRYTDV